jgi:hydrogenase maturation protein HypF
VTTLGLRIEIRGTVQGVGFRPWIYRLATEAGLAGHVRNDSAGVTIEAFGPGEALDAFLRRLDGSPGPPAATIQEICSGAIPPAPVDTFSILQSEESAERQLSIPPDLAMCPRCAVEILEATNRRFRYPFTNCTDCGPRFTIARDVPYDRPATTMATFEMCECCQHEYESVSSRRFHAQPNACPVCGPRLALLQLDGRHIEHDDPIGAVADALRTGRIVAIKGLGGFHLACDATSPQAVQELRARKRRDDKPFAVMVNDLEHARECALLTEEECRLLTSVERPIVLATRRDGCALTPEVAPDTNLVGLLLPYTPLHYLLMGEVGRPIVMTSGNLSDEPIVHQNDDAFARLRRVADLFLLHDRDIEARCDDSVARVVAGRPVVLRRSRGYVPRPIVLPTRLHLPVLACGALLKNTFCIGKGETAYLGPHIGDLENLDAYGSFEESVARMERLLRLTPAVIAYDLHPEYLSTRYALARPESIKIGVQHHHAHIASAMAEHQLAGPVIGVAFDGTGYGPDGTAWGGEVMVARYGSFERVATLRPIPLPGGDAAIRHPWRIALALVMDAFDGRAPLDRLGLFSQVALHDLEVVRQMLAARVRTPLAHGAGRYFDGIGSLALQRAESRYEGQIALAWNAAADPVESGRYDYEIDRQQVPWTVDLRSMVRAVVRDLVGDTPVPRISARFHNALVAATAEVVCSVTTLHGTLPIVLSGGCFQNPLLAEGLVRELSSRFTVHLPGQVPPGDGGLSLGQAVVADAIARQLMA